MPLRVHPRPGLLGSRLRLQQLVLLEVAAALVAVGWTIAPAMAAPSPSPPSCSSWWPCCRSAAAACRRRCASARR
ncbi:hypothetical protein ACFQ1I_16790 [Kitasatospora arboriphila]